MSDDTPGRAALIVAAACGAVMLISGILSATARHGSVSTTPTDAVTATTGAYQDNFVTGSDEEFRTTSLANVRDVPSGTDSNVLESLPAGTMLTGKQVVGSSNASARWLRIERNGRVGYVWDGNLAPSAAAAPAPVETAVTVEPPPADVPAPVATKSSPVAAAPIVAPDRSASRREARNNRGGGAASEPRLTCLLPSGGEATMTRDRCTASGGVADR